MSLFPTNFASGTIHPLLLFGLCLGATEASWALNPSVPAGSNFDLSHWYLQLPTSGGVLTGIPNSNYLVLTTTSLGLSWWPVSTNAAAANSALQVSDPHAINGQQFYRLTLP